MASDHDDGQDHEILQDHVKRLEVEAHRIGLHIQEAGGMRQHSSDGTHSRLVIQAVFMIGDLAFSDEIDQPEKTVWDERFERITDEEQRRDAIEMFKRWGKGEFL